MMWISRAGKRERHTLTGRRQPRVTTLALVIASAVAASAGLAWTPAALAATCEVPAVATPDRGLSPAITGSPALTPATGSSIIQIEGEDEAEAATAVSLAAATPAAATPVSPAPDPIELLDDELTAVSESLAACLSAGDAEAVTRLAGERYLGQLFGSSVPFSRDDYVAIASELTPIPTQIVTLEDVSQSGDDRATALVTQIVGNQLVRAEWTFEPAPSDERRAGENSWRLAGERQMPVPAPPTAAPIDVEIGDRSFTLDETTVEGLDIVLSGANVSDEDHEMLVLRVAPGYTTADLLRASGPDLPEAVTFVGAATVPAGEEGNLVLVDLEPGVYTLVCLFPDQAGTPHLAQGMEAAFTVE